MAKDNNNDVASDGAVRLADHPRARRHIGAAKGWGGLGAFALAVLVSLQAAVPLADALLRGVLAGLAGYVVGWGLAVFAWRQLAVAEVEAARRRLVDAQAEVAPAAVER